MSMLLSGSGLLACFSEAAFREAPEPGAHRAHLVALLPENPEVAPEILLSHKEEALVHPASLAKLVTAHVVLDMLKNGKIEPYQEVHVSPRAREIQTPRSGAKTLTIERALDLMAVASCNDAAVALAEHISQTEGHFTLHRINPLLEKLGATNTHLWNVTGLPSDQSIYREEGLQHHVPSCVTTAEDMLKITASLLRRHPEYLERSSLRALYDNQRTLRNTNQLIRDSIVCPKAGHFNGLKTGTLEAAGYHMIATCPARGGLIVTIVLGEVSAPMRSLTVQRLSAQAADRIMPTASTLEPEQP